MQRHVSQGLDLDSEICLVSSAGLIGAGLLAETLGAPVFAFIFVLSGIAVGMTATATRAYIKRHKGARR